MPSDHGLTQQSGSSNILPPATIKRQKKKTKSGAVDAKSITQAEVQSRKNSNWRFAWFIFVWMLIFGYMATSSGGRLQERDALGDAVMTLIIMMAALAYYYGRKVATMPFGLQAVNSDLPKKNAMLQPCEQHQSDLVEAAESRIANRAVHASHSTSSAVIAKEVSDDSVVKPSVQHESKSSGKILQNGENAEKADTCEITRVGEEKANVAAEDMGVTIVTPLPLHSLRPRFNGGAAWADIDSDDEACFPEMTNCTTLSKCDLLENHRAGDTPSTSENGSLEGLERSGTPSTADSNSEGQCASQEADVPLQTDQDESSGCSKSLDEEADVSLQASQEELTSSLNRVPLQVNASPFVPGTIQSQTAPVVEYTSVPVLVPNAFDYGQGIPFTHQDLDAQQMFGMPIADTMNPSCMKDSWDYYGGFSETDASQTGHFMHQLSGAGNMCFHDPQQSEFVPYLDVSSQVAFEHNFRMNIASADVAPVERTINDFSDSDYEPNAYEAFDSDSDEDGDLPVTTARWWAKTLSEKTATTALVRTPPKQKPLKKIPGRASDWEAPHRVVRSLNALDLIQPTARRRLANM